MRDDPAEIRGYLDRQGVPGLDNIDDDDDRVDHLREQQWSGPGGAHGVTIEHTIYRYEHAARKIYFSNNFLSSGQRLV